MTDSQKPSTEAGIRTVDAWSLVVDADDEMHAAIEHDLAEIEQEARAPLEAVVAAARLPRNALIDGDVGRFIGRWVAVPEQDFAALRAALLALDTEKETAK